MQQMSAHMESEYQRIQKRAVEDPGTAGDQGEENWATLLRGWLPTTYDVVTKGRIIGHDGQTSPQIDVLVLSSSYPMMLRDRKLFLAGGVLAAFECKNTLKAQHLKDAIETCKKVKGLCPPQMGTPFKELQAPIIYGIFAHSHSWKDQNSKPVENVKTTVFAHELENTKAPSELLDLVCVADLATWVRRKIILLGSNAKSVGAGQYGDVITLLICHSESPQQGAGDRNFTPIGCLIGGLFQKLAYVDSTAISMANYYIAVGVVGDGNGTMRPWSDSVFSGATKAKILRGSMKYEGAKFDEWGSVIL